VVFCPEGVIQKDKNEYIKIEYDYCKGCGICAYECLKCAIHIGDHGRALLKVPIILPPLPSGGATVTGVSRALRAKGSNEVQAVCIGDDSCFGDMDFQTLSGACQRNENVIFICLDN